MSTQIWKLTLSPQFPVIAMPKGAKVLCVHEQRGEVCLWAEVNTNAEQEFRTFEVYGTGHAIPDGKGKYIGTAFLAGQSLVFHVYEAA